MTPEVSVYLEHSGLRQPRWPKPHVMRLHGWWYLVDTQPNLFGTWMQEEPITSDPRV